jgi:phosphatidate cytidylyltransferase
MVAGLFTLVFALVCALGFALAIGVGILAILSVWPRTAAAARPLWITLLTELVILAGALVPFLIGGPFLYLWLGLLSARISYEASTVALLRLGEGHALSPADRALAAAGAVLGVGLAAVATNLEVRAAVLAGAAAAAILAIALALLNAASWRRAGALCEASLLPGVPLLVFLSAATDPTCAGALVVAFLLVETFDSYALLGGKIAGRHHVFRWLSPNKTMEGLVIGAFALCVTAVVAGHLLFSAPPAIALAVAVLVAAFAVAGDLAASRLKRIAGVKDYPAILPRQGGLLDIVDAWLLAGPALAIASLTARTL